MTKLLNIDANPKTVKGQKKGYMTAVLYLAPFKSAGLNVCPMAELAGCAAACLNTSGRGGIAKGTYAPHGVELPDNAIQRARIRRTRHYAEDRDGFMRQLTSEIAAFVRRARRKGLTPAVRLNGTSDIQFETIRYSVGEERPQTIFERFEDVQFYDYTKIAKRFARRLPPNYHLSLSFSDASIRYRDMCLDAAERFNAPLVYVARNETVKKQMIGAYSLCSRPVVDGDQTDLRFTDPAGAVVVLRAKGAARKDQTGFVLD